MAEKTKSLLDGQRANPFAESVARFAAIARPNDPAPEAAPAADRISAVSPDEVWSRRFMSMGIGPDKNFAGPVPRIPAPDLAATPEEFAPQTELVPQKALGRPDKSGPIGLAIGKPVRRSLMAKLLGRR
jgi:hypothetical protein